MTDPLIEFNSFVDECHALAVEKGFWDEAMTESVELGPQVDLDISAEQIPKKLMLIVSEASEVLEEYRNGHAPTETYYKYPDFPQFDPAVHDRPETPAKPEGIPAELADIVIRVCDLAGALQINLAEALREKMDYNWTRPGNRYGGKRA